MPRQPTPFHEMTTHDVATGCILWRGFIHPSGYGIIKRGGRNQRAHRVVWEMTHGRIPEGMVIRHVVCRTPACVNVAHLAIGTPADNSADRVRDGMSGRGETSQNTRLTRHHARVIRYLVRHGTMGQRRIASMFGLTQAAVSHIARRKTWFDTSDDVWDA